MLTPSPQPCPHGRSHLPARGRWQDLQGAQLAAVLPARTSATVAASLPTPRRPLLIAHTRMGQELAFAQENLFWGPCSSWVLVLVLSWDGEPSLGQPCLDPHPCPHSHLNPSLTLSPSLSQCLSLCLHFCTQGVPSGGAPASGSGPHHQVQQATSCTLRRMDTAVCFGSLCSRESLHRCKSPSLRSQPAPGAAPPLG